MTALQKTSLSKIKRQASKWERTFVIDVSTEDLHPEYAKKRQAADLVFFNGQNIWIDT